MHQDDQQRAIARLRALARLLDAAITIPGTRIQIGLDPILGLVPGIGDAAGFLLSFSILAGAYRLGAPPELLSRMAKNVVIETVVGAVPILGDLFDAGWKANLRNVRLLEDHFAAPVRAPRPLESPIRRLAPLIAAAALGAVVTAAIAIAWLQLG